MSRKRDASGRFTSSPEAKFRVGEVVSYLRGIGGIVEITDRTHAENRGWVYGISYAHIENGKVVVSGGGSFWWEETDLANLQDSQMKLMAEVHYRAVEKKRIERRLQIVNEELRNLEFALSAIAPEQEAADE